MYTLSIPCMRSSVHDGYTWVPPHPSTTLWMCPGPQISTAGSNFNTLLAAYHGTNLGSLRLLDSNDNCDQTTTTSCVTLTVKPMASDFVCVL
jgi:hypothetical protein